MMRGALAASRGGHPSVSLRVRRGGSSVPSAGPAAALRRAKSVPARGAVARGRRAAAAAGASRARRRTPSAVRVPRASPPRASSRRAEKSHAATAPPPQTPPRAPLQEQQLHAAAPLSLPDGAAPEDATAEGHASSNGRSPPRLSRAAPGSPPAEGAPPRWIAGPAGGAARDAEGDADEPSEPFAVVGRGGGSGDDGGGGDTSWGTLPSTQSDPLLEARYVIVHSSRPCPVLDSFISITRRYMKLRRLVDRFSGGAVGGSGGGGGARAHGAAGGDKRL